MEREGQEEREKHRKNCTDFVAVGNQMFSVVEIVWHVSRYKRENNTEAEPHKHIHTYTQFLYGESARLEQK